MATASGGRLDEDPNFSSINAYRDCDNALQCAPVNDSRSNLLTDVLNVEESVQNCTLLQLFTPEYFLRLKFAKLAIAYYRERKFIKR